MRTKIIGIRLTLTLAVGIFLLTVLLFAAAMIIANALSIPQPTARFLPFSARGLPENSDQPSDDASLANDIRSGRAESKDEPVPTVTAVPEPSRSGAPMVSSGGGNERATQTSPTIHRWVTSGNRDAQGPAPYWWNQIPRAPEQPGSTPSSSPTPRSTTRVPWWRSPGYRPTPEPSEPEPTEPEPSEPEPTEPEPTEPEPTEPEPTEPEPTEPEPSEPELTASEPTGSEATEPLASESATE